MINTGVGSLKAGRSGPTLTFHGSMIRKFWNTLKFFHESISLTYNKSKSWLRPWNAGINFRRLRPNSESSLAIRLCATLNIEAVKICPSLCGVGY